MPLTSEWTTDTANVTSTVSVQHHTSTPLDGNRSVRFNITTGGGGGSKGAGAVFLVTPTYVRGHVMGRLQTLMRVDSDVTLAGIYFLASQATGIAGAGSAYMFGPGGALNTLKLQKTSGGLFAASPTTLHTIPVNVGASDPTDTFALEVEWKADLNIFGGTSIICRYGVDLNNLADVLEYVDETSPLLASSAEGLFAFRSGTSVVGQAIFDDTSVYNIALS